MRAASRLPSVGLRGPRAGHRAAAPGALGSLGPNCHASSAGPRRGLRRRLAEPELWRDSGGAARREVSVHAGSSPAAHERRTCQRLDHATFERPVGGTSLPCTGLRPMARSVALDPRSARFMPIRPLSGWVARGLMQVGVVARAALGRACASAALRGRRVHAVDKRRPTQASAWRLGASGEDIVHDLFDRPGRVDANSCRRDVRLRGEQFRD